MKKILLILTLLFPVWVCALGSIDVDTNDIYIKKGESVPLDVILNNAAGRIDIVSTDNLVVEVSEERIFLDSDSKEIILSGLKTGESVIRVYTYDVSTYDSEDLSDNTYSVNVYVYVKGDTNGDETINIYDVIGLLRKYLMGEASERDIVINDMDDNGVLGMNDVISLLREYLFN